MIRDRLDSGEDFAALAREFSADSFSAERGGDLGWLAVGEEPAPEFAEALLDMQPGDISAPVRTDYGFHLIRLTAVRPSDTVEFASVRDDLLARLRDDQGAELYGQQLDELDDLALESLDGLAPVAETMGLELKTQKGFTRSGALPLGTGANLVDAVFSLEVLEDGENSPIIELDDGRAVVVKVSAHYLPELKPLEEVRDSIEVRLRTNEAMLLAASKGSGLVEQLQGGVDANTLATEYGGEWQMQNAVRRGGQVLPPDLTSAIFKAAAPSGQQPEYKGLLLASGDYAIYQVVGVLPGQPEFFDPESRNQRKQMLANQLGMSQLNALMSDLTEAASTTVTPNLIGDDTDLL